MIELKGQYCKDCKIFTNEIEESALQQLYQINNHKIFANQPIRIMPDCHAGAGCVIGFTAPMAGEICPNLIGVDIGCGMLSVIIERPENNFPEILDEYIHKNIPSGTSVRDKILPAVNSLDLKKLKTICEKVGADENRVLLSLGTLGGGNHFIEAGHINEKYDLITVHSGSRNFGLKIANYHQKKAVEKTGSVYGKSLAWLEGEEANEYLEDMRFAQEYASLNRRFMLTRLVTNLDLKLNMNLLKVFVIESVHNYIGDDNIIRKGAISAYKDQLVIIPWNMRDGLIIGKGKGNKDWNYSAPHGAGRVMSRSKAKAEIDLQDFQKTMEGIYSTSVNKSTIDESPMAYKDPQQIQEYLKDSVEILYKVKPYYNFKA